MLIILSWTQVEEEDYDLCVATQRNLNAGIYNRGVLNPNTEVCSLASFFIPSTESSSGQNGVLYYQGRVKEYVEEHLALEKKLGNEWNPAQPRSQCESKGTKGCGGESADSVCTVSSEIRYSTTAAS